MNFFYFDKISYLLGSSSRRIEVSASLQEGSVLLVRGPSGSGKSTLLRVLARLQKLADGQVFYMDVGMLSFTPQVWRSKVHYVPQKPVAFSGTVNDNLQIPYTLRINKVKEIDLHVIKKFLVDLMLDIDILGQNANTLSGGELARVALLRAVIFNPNILLLDEPAAALDVITKKAVMDFLKSWLKQAPERGIILISHADESTTFPSANVLDIGG